MLNNDIKMKIYSFMTTFINIEQSTEQFNKQFSFELLQYGFLWRNFWRRWVKLSLNLIFDVPRWYDGFRIKSHNGVHLFPILEFKFGHKSYINQNFKRSNLSLSLAWEYVYWTKNKVISEIWIQEQWSKK